MDKLHSTRMHERRDTLSQLQKEEGRALKVPCESDDTIPEKKGRRGKSKTKELHFEKKKRANTKKEKGLHCRCSVSITHCKVLESETLQSMRCFLLWQSLFLCFFFPLLSFSFTCSLPTAHATADRTVQVLMVVLSSSQNRHKLHWLCVVRSPLSPLH